MEKSDKLTYSLSKAMVIILFFYYGIIILCGAYVSICVAITLEEGLAMKKILEDAFVVSIAVSGMLSSIQYIKRLYKACITNRIDTSGSIIKKIGNMAYFVFRPIFAFAFSIIMVFAVLAGMFVVIGGLDYILNEKFVYMCVLLSSLLGYSIGKWIDKFADISIEKVMNIK